MCTPARPDARPHARTQMRVRMDDPMGDLTRQAFLAFVDDVLHLVEGKKAGRDNTKKLGKDSREWKELKQEGQKNTTPRRSFYP